MNESRAFDIIGRVVAVFAVVFTLACAVGCLWILADAYHASEQPTFVIAPDTAKAKGKP